MGIVAIEELWFAHSSTINSQKAMLSALLVYTELQKTVLLLCKGLDGARVSKQNEPHKHHHA